MSRYLMELIYMLNFVRYYEFTFFQIDENNNLTDIQNSRISNSINFSFSYSTVPGTFNTAKFYFYNISENTLKLFASKNNRRGFYFRACYDDPKLLKNSLIYRGLTYRVNSYHEGVDLITEVTAADPYFSLQQASIKSINEPNGITAIDLLNKISNYLGIFNEISGESYLTLKPRYNHPVSFSNVPITKILDMIAHDNGCTWSFDIRGIKIFPRPNRLQSNDLGLISAIPLISRSTGLVGNVRAETLSVQLFPQDYFSQQRLKNNHPFISVTCLLRLLPVYSSVEVKCEFEELNGIYTVYKVNYEGEYRSLNWFTHLQLTPQVIQQ